MIRVANKMAKVIQQTVHWYVNNLKLSHMSYKGNTQVINQLEKIYDKNMTIKCKTHKYLGIHLDFRLKSKMKVGMTEYIKESVNIWPKILNTPVKTPVGRHLLKLNPDVEKLEIKKVKLFHAL